MQRSRAVRCLDPLTFAGGCWVSVAGARKGEVEDAAGDIRPSVIGRGPSPSRRRPRSAAGEVTEAPTKETLDPGASVAWHAVPWASSTSRGRCYYYARR